MKETPYNQRYAGEGFYWGKKPSSMAPRVLEAMPLIAGLRPRLIDLGCGEGRDIVYFARHGFEVTGLDLSPVGLEKAERYAKEARAQIETIHADVADYELEGAYDVIFSTGTLHFIPPEARQARFEHYKAHTSPDGIHVVTVLVDKPFLPIAPDADPGETLFRPGELLACYWDWEVVYFVEEIFDCKSSGTPHKHCADRIIARRYQDR
ncbi:MAG: cyclopropane-fatty-acyl-phospholipid synthase family protein [Anaerolineae bacterium]|jgi:tellurite methyltransferase